MRWSSTSRRSGRAPAGQSLVEHALVVGMFFLAALMVIELGFFFFSYAVATNAAKEGARIGAASYPFDQAAIVADVEAAAESAALNSMTRLGLDATPEMVSANLPSAVPGNTLRVSIVYPHQPFTGVLPTITVAVTSTVRLE